MTTTAFPLPSVAAVTAKSSDAAKLTLTLPVVITIVIAVAGFGIQQAMSLSALRSDVRDLKTMMDNAKEADVLQRENLDLKLANMKAEIEKSELRKALLTEMQANK